MTGVPTPAGVALDRQLLGVGGDTEAIVRAYRRHHGVSDEDGDRG